MNNKFYLTTTLPYVNDIPHIGHALEFIQADVITRFMREKIGSENVLFNVGTDEHGLKIYQKAKEKGLTPQQYTDQYAEKWQEFCKLFGISYDNFYRTSQSYHKEPAQKFWLTSNKKGDIYKKSYTGLYCVGCEEFKTEKQLVDGKCPDHNKEPIELSEENYFFRLSKYREELLSWLDKYPEVVKPANKIEELKNWVKNMEDISISRVRKNLPWGVEVPNDSDQVMYVWFDALTNYVNAIGYGTNEEKLKQWWPGVQVFGPDNLRFQGAIWQAMLASAQLPHTKKLLCHGMILASDGTKMSKTKGNVVSPFDQNDKFGYEAVRFYMIAGLSTYGDTPYKEEDLQNIYNAYLANNFGNLLNRVIHLANKKEVEINNLSKIEHNFKSTVDDFVSRINQRYSLFELQDAATLTNDLSNFGNQYITEKEPWNKDLVKEEVEIILNNLSYLISRVITCYAPIIPESCNKAEKMLRERNSGVLFAKLENTNL